MQGFGVEMAPEATWREADFVHNVLVLNNVINSYGPGIFLGMDTDLSGTPTLYTNNFNVDFINNRIQNCGLTPFLMTSSAQVRVINTSFVNVLCFDEDTTNYNWQVKGSLIFLANVDNITFSGNTATTNSGCRHMYGNYNQPVALVNATNIHGLTAAPKVDALLLRDRP